MGNKTDRLENRYGTGTERIWNGYGTDTEWMQDGNGNRNACRTETERVLSSVPCQVSSDQYSTSLILDIYVTIN